MDASLHGRNLAFLLSLGVLPACPGKDGETDGTATDPTTGDATGPDAPTTGGTTGDTTGTSGTSGTSDTTGGTGDPVSPGCQAYAAKLVECFPREAMNLAMIEQVCAGDESYFAGTDPECIAHYEDYLVCLSKLACADFSDEAACQADLDATFACNEG